jgi:hypothetical protein
MKEHTLLEAFEHGAREGRKAREVQPAILEIWKLVANKFTAGFDVVYDERNKLISVTAGKRPADPLDIDFNAPNITVKDLGNGTFQINTGFRNMGTPPETAEKTLEALGRFYGRNTAGTLKP